MSEKYATPYISLPSSSMQQGVCVEVLIMTVIVWAAVWGILEELLQGFHDKRLRLGVFLAILLSTLFVAKEWAHLSMCVLL